MQVVLGKNSHVYVWRKSEERWNTQCLGLYGSCHGGARVSVMFWGCICKDGVGTITDVEGNITSAKYIDILDNNLWPVVAKFENNKMTMPRYISQYRQNCGKITMMSIVLIGHPNHQILI